jgi:hypothetical protein
MVVYGLWCLTPLSTIFQFYRGGELYCWWKKPENPEKVTACRKSLSLVYMTKTLNQIIFFFLHQNQNIFFSNIGNQNIFLEKNHIL